ncbi:unnamed protein product [Rotaria magnacalcarata]|uniref:Thioredoxin domain-containing protein n=1 Tax=Rotaria magnacalcarata TaxID=392030 RepID=A0A816VV14_9BILA|nr:unnamed protein product [Rotaria magnacalcarata]CAF2125385.1 unnamed protein product [Rotaria magnacalcarata]CAF3815987.1 unnamed protein product [Rotaria magnacalcarata]CAF3836866.1 unnamed protein product [Rotaria magnacalcarata]
MLKATSAPYSEKLRRATRRRINGIESSLLNNTNLKIGDHAPNFSLYNTANEQVSLYNFTKRSNVVLLFFPLAFSDVCTDELCFIRDNMDKYNQLNARVIGISVDSMFALNKFKEEKQLQFDLLSDFNKDVARNFGVLYDEFPLFNMKGVTKRAAFVLDQKETIRYMEILDDPGKMPDFEAIEQILNTCSVE